MKRNPKGQFVKLEPNETKIISDSEIGIILKRKDGSEHICIIDSVDYPLVRAHRWTARVSSKTHYRNTQYAVSQLPRKEGKQITISMHALLAGGPGVSVDHRDMNGLNNRRENLRQTNATGNARNKVKPRTNTSGWKCVVKRKDTGKWRAQITVNGKKLSLGQYSTGLEAAHAYDEAALLYHGEFARPNFSTLSVFPAI